MQLTNLIIYSMEIEEAIKKIVDNFEMLLKKQGGKTYGHYDSKVVWFFQSDHSANYEIDEENLGVTADGKIAWSFASGCSCWDGDYEKDVCDTVSMKEFELKHEDMRDEWKNKLIEFAAAII